MSEQDKIICSNIIKGIEKAQRDMLERKAKLGEPVVYADREGKPYTLSAKDALKKFDSTKM